MGISSFATAQSLRSSNHEYLKGRAPASSQIDNIDFKNDCIRKADSLQSQKEITAFAAKCFSRVQSKANPKNLIHSEDGRFTVFTSDNMIFVKKQGIALGEETQFIVGKNPSLNQILSVKIDAAREEIYVLDSVGGSQRRILVYSIGSSGIQDPIRLIDHESIQNASDIAIDPVNEKLFVSIPDNSKVLILNQLATKHSGSIPKFQQAPIAQLDLSNDQVRHPASLAVHISKKKLFVADQSSPKVLVISTDNLLSVESNLDLSKFGISAAAEALGTTSDNQLEVINSKTGKLQLVKFSQP